jgi:hypothetical protein
MTDYANFKATIAEWSNRQDWSDALVSSFVSMAEQKLNAELRVDRMIEFAEIVCTCRCANLPDDWLEMDLVQGQSQGPATGFSPWRYRPRDEFFNLTDEHAWGYYTIEGRVITFGGTPNQTEGLTYTIAYYGEVPVFSDTQDSWVYTKYPNLYLFAALMHADLHAVGEEQNAAHLKQLAEDMIQKLNADHLRSKASGSRLTWRGKRGLARSFG